ncbi:MaoC family dehydratase [Microbulbifer sp. CnH-101-G]|uniref:MaoC family dehydratase n=1 Tax=Microbulbifer sp. CnH-101-G TaxID=3243393 RepID=UPI004039153B
MKDSLHFLREVEPNTYIETCGVDYEDFEVGQIFEHRPGHTFSEASCLNYARHSFDLSPGYADQRYARRVYGDRVRVPETFVLSVMALTTRTFGKVVANLSMTECKVKAVYAGDTLYLESEILGKRKSKSRPDQGLLHISSRALNQDGVCVCSFERKLLVYRRNLGPYEKAGY